MPKFLIIYHMEEVWPSTGRESLTCARTFDNEDTARMYMDDLMDTFGSCMEVQLYENVSGKYTWIDGRNGNE